MTKNEQQLKAKLESEGWTVLRNGWPDFLIFRHTDNGSEVIAVEQKDTNELSLEQQKMIHALNLMGLPVLVMNKHASIITDFTPERALKFNAQFLLPHVASKLDDAEERTDNYVDEIHYSLRRVMKNFRKLQEKQEKISKLIGEKSILDELMAQTQARKGVI